MALHVLTISSIRRWQGSAAPWQELIVDQWLLDQLRNHFCIISRCREIKVSSFCTLRCRIWGSLTSSTNTLPSLYIQELQEVYSASSTCIIHYSPWSLAFHVEHGAAPAGSLGRSTGSFWCNEDTTIRLYSLIHMHPWSQAQRYSHMKTVHTHTLRCTKHTEHTHYRFMHCKCLFMETTGKPGWWNTR